MPRIFTLLKTIPSGSHNSFFSEEHGQHWPAGQQFKLLPKYAQDRYGCTLFEQIGGEEVHLSVPFERVAELFGPGVGVGVRSEAYELRKQLREHKREMKARGIRRTSFMNGGLSSEEYAANAECFRLETMIERIGTV